MHSVTRKFMDVCDEEATGEDGSVSQHDDHSKEHPLECGLSCGQRDLFSAFASRHRRPVARLHVSVDQ